MRLTLLKLSIKMKQMKAFSHGHRRRRAVSFRLSLTQLMREGQRTLIEKSAGAGHRAVSLHRDCVLVFFIYV